MGTDVQIVPATVELAETFAPFMRDEDVAEVAALGLSPLQALTGSISKSNISSAVLFDGEVAAMFGVMEKRTIVSTSAKAMVWMLSGRICAKRRKDFLRASRFILSHLLQSYDELFNVIDARYSGALRWAQWLGAKLEAEQPLGPYGIPFRYFTFRRP